MAMNTFLAHCVLFELNSHYFVLQKMEVTSPVSCSMKCSFFKDSSANSGFLYEKKMRKKSNYKDESHATLYRKADSKTKQLKGIFSRGTCYCVSGNHQHAMSVKFNNSRVCLFKTDTTQKTTYGAACGTNRNCNGRGLYCRKGKCKCKKSHKYNKRKKTCKKVDRHKHGRSCKGKTDCNEKNNICFHGSCKCKPKYFHVKRTNLCKRGCNEFADTMTVYPNLRFIRNRAVKKIRLKKSMTYKQAINSCIKRCTKIDIICKFAHLKFALGSQCYLITELEKGKLKFDTGKKSNNFTFLTRNCLDDRNQLSGSFYSYDSYEQAIYSKGDTQRMRSN